MPKKYHYQRNEKCNCDNQGADNVAENLDNTMLAFAMGPGGPGPGGPDRRCCAAFNEIRAFYLQQQAAGIRQISFELNIIDPTTGLRYELFVDDPRWFINDRRARCTILVNIHNNVLGIPDAFINCVGLNNFYRPGSLTVIV